MNWPFHCVAGLTVAHVNPQGELGVPRFTCSRSVGGAHALQVGLRELWELRSREAPCAHGQKVRNQQG